MPFAMRNTELTNEDFGFLRGCIAENPKALPCDIDMVLERRGSFLFAEWKQEGEKFSEGQRRMLESLSMKQGVIVLAIRGDTKQGIVGKIYKMEKKAYKLVGEGADDLKRLINIWYKWANADKTKVDWVAEYERNEK